MDERTRLAGRAPRAHEADFAEPALFSLPGWPSVESALDFLKEEARRDPEVSVRAGPLRYLFASVGVAL